MRVIARQHKAMLEAHLADVLAGTGAPPELAREIWLLSEGAISLMLKHGNRSYAAAAADAAKQVLKSQADKNDPRGRLRR